jgi:hypothetical protein
MKAIYLKAHEVKFILAACSKDVSSITSCA